MYIGTITLQNFRCFGAEGTTIALGSGLIAFVGANGAGKTAVLQGLQRMIGDERRLRCQDFHVSAAEQASPMSRMLALEVILAFPELDDGTDAGAVPKFFQQMRPTGPDGSIAVCGWKPPGWTMAQPKERLSRLTAWSGPLARSRKMTVATSSRLIAPALSWSMSPRHATARRRSRPFSAADFGRR